MTKMLILVPTRSRPAAVQRVVDAWVATDAFEVANLQFVIDLDDPEADAYLNEVQRAQVGAGGYLSVALEPTWRPMVHKLDAAAREACTLFPGLHAIGFAGDDHLPRTRGWARAYVETLAGPGHGIVFCDDGYQHDTIPTQWAMTASIVRRLGRMVPAPVEHLYCDNAVRDLGNALGALTYLPQYMIEHMHPVVGKASDDEQYRRVNGGPQFRRDRRAYREWQRQGLPDDLAKLKEEIR